MTRDVVVEGWREASNEGSGGRRRSGRMDTFTFLEFRMVVSNRHTILVSSGFMCSDIEKYCISRRGWRMVEW